MGVGREERREERERMKGRKGRKEGEREGRKKGKKGGRERGRRASNGRNLSINKRHSEGFQFNTSPLYIPQIRLSRTQLLSEL